MFEKLTGRGKWSIASRVIATILCIALITGLEAGCAKPAPTSTLTPTTAPTTKPATTAAVKPVKLSFALFFANTGAIAEAMNRVIDEVQKRSNGRLTLVPYWSGSLLPQRGTGEGVKAGVADIGYFYYSQAEMMVPLSQVTVQLGAARGNAWAGFKAFDEFMELPLIKKEWTGQNMKSLWPVCALGSAFFGKTPARTIEDLKKLRIHASPPGPEVLNKLGITAVDLPSAEIYEALMRGTIDAVIYPTVNVPTWRYHEASKYANLDIPGWGSKYYNIAINLDVWNSLPQDLQGILKDVPAGDIVYETYIFKGEKAAIETIKKAGVEFINSPPEVAKTIDEVGLVPLREEWIKATVSRGFASDKEIRDLLNQWIALNDKWTAQYPAYAKKVGWE